MRVEVSPSVTPNFLFKSSTFALCFAVLLEVRGNCLVKGWDHSIILASRLQGKGMVAKQRSEADSLRPACHRRRTGGCGSASTLQVDSSRHGTIKTQIPSGDDNRMILRSSDDEMVL